MQCICLHWVYGCEFWGQQIALKVRKLFIDRCVLKMTCRRGSRSSVRLHGAQSAQLVFLISSVVAKYLTASQPHIEGAKKIIIHIFSQPYVVCVLYVSIHFIYFLNMPSLVCTCSTCTSIFSDILWMHLYDTTDDMCQIYWCLFLIGLKWWFVMEF